MSALSILVKEYSCVRGVGWLVLFCFCGSLTPFCQKRTFTSSLNNALLMWTLGTFPLEIYLSIYISNVKIDKLWLSVEFKNSLLILLVEQQTLCSRMVLKHILSRVFQQLSLCHLSLVWIALEVFIAWLCTFHSWSVYVKAINRKCMAKPGTLVFHCSFQAHFSLVLHLVYHC